MPVELLTETLPCSARTRLWRYIDVRKLTDLLSTGTLYFARADRFEDPWEGALSEVNEEEFLKIYSEIPSSDAEDLRAHISRWFHDVLPKHTYISCWHANAGESAAMWELYSVRDRGIAVVTTLGRLQRAFAQPGDSLLIGGVEYVDYESSPIRERESFAPYLSKRRAFSHENEVRVLLQNFPTHPVEDSNARERPYITVSTRDGWRLVELDELEAMETPEGVSLPVSLDSLLLELYLAPGASESTERIVQEALEEHQVDVRIHRSQLYEAPERTDRPR